MQDLIALLLSEAIKSQINKTYNSVAYPCFISSRAYMCVTCVGFCCGIKTIYFFSPEMPLRD